MSNVPRWVTSDKVRADIEARAARHAELSRREAEARQADEEAGR